jgi:hypothetical protein
VYVQADADFTAQLVYTAPDGSTLTKTLQVTIDRNATAEYPSLTVKSLPSPSAPPLR